MAAEGLRRSKRAKRQVKSYAEEQAKALVTATAQRIRPSASHEKDSERPVAEADDEAVDERPAKKKRSATKIPAKVLDDGMQLYGAEAEAEAAMIPWTIGRMRRQPKVWEVKKPVASGNPTWTAEVAEKRIAARLNEINKLAPGEEEYRLLDYIHDEDDLSDAYLSALKKVYKEKMFILDRVRDVHEDCHTKHEGCPCETLTVAGSKGNVYTVTISHLMTCTCPVAVWQKNGDESVCKHIIYVLHKILKAPDHLKYQQAYLTCELEELFAHAPRLPSEVAEESAKDGNRKEATGECPVCFERFDDEEELTWCKAACGNNLHVVCFQQWERARNPVTCPYCRAHWQHEDAPQAGDSKQKTTVTKVELPTNTGAGGYYNVKDQLDYD